MSKDQFVLRSKSVEFIRRGYKALAGYFRNRLGNFSVKAGRSVQSCTDGCTSERQFVKLRKSKLKKFSIALKLAPPAADLL